MCLWALLKALLVVAVAMFLFQADPPNLGNLARLPCKLVRHRAALEAVSLLVLAQETVALEATQHSLLVVSLPQTDVVVVCIVWLVTPVMTVCTDPRRGLRFL